jgi:hypothetical protein
MGKVAGMSETRAIGKPAVEAVSAEHEMIGVSLIMQANSFTFVQPETVYNPAD